MTHKSRQSELLIFSSPHPLPLPPARTPLEVFSSPSKISKLKTHENRRNGPDPTWPFQPHLAVPYLPSEKTSLPPLAIRKTPIFTPVEGTETEHSSLSSYTLTLCTQLDADYLNYSLLTQLVEWQTALITRPTPDQWVCAKSKGRTETPMSRTLNPRKRVLCYPHAKPNTPRAVAHTHHDSVTSSLSWE